MRGAQQNIDKVSLLLKAREMFLAVTKARDGRSFFVGTGSSAKKSVEHRTLCMAEKGATQEGCFKTTFKDSIAYMQGQGFEYQNGMIVRSLNKMEKILLGQTTGLTMTAEEKALT
ncbi:hypothetical protein, partial [Leptospira ilyithenensis]